LMMGLEEHLLGMFREDFEFNDQAVPSHLGSAHSKNEVKKEDPVQIVVAQKSTENAQAQWTQEASQELQKIPFFVRGKARRNTERYATEQGVLTITVETLYDAKAHFSR